MLSATDESLALATAAASAAASAGLIAITGCTGNVGEPLARLLLAQPAVAPRLVLAARGAAKVQALFGPQAAQQFRRLDLFDRATYAPALAGCSAAFVVFVEPSPGAVRSRLLPLLQAGVEGGVRHFVYLSVVGADKHAMIPHHAVEAELQRLAATVPGLTYTVLRGADFFQNLIREPLTLFVDIARHDTLYVPAGSARTTFVDAEDVAEIAALALTAPEQHANQAYDITGDEGARLTWKQVAEQLSAVAGRPIKYTDPLTGAFAWRLWRRNVRWDFVLFMGIKFAAVRWDMSDTPVEDTVQRLLGRPPRGLQEFAEKYREYWDPRSGVVAAAAGPHDKPVAVVASAKVGSAAAAEVRAGVV